MHLSNKTPCLFTLMNSGSLKTDKQHDKEAYPLIPWQISPNPQRRRGNDTSLSSSELSADTSIDSLNSSVNLRHEEPILSFTNLLDKRHGSVLGRDIILKSEHFFKGTNNINEIIYQINQSSLNYSINL